MLYSKKARRWIANFLIVFMCISLFLPWDVQKAEAAGQDLQVFFGKGVQLGNLSYPATNSFVNFTGTPEPGFAQTTFSDRGSVFGDGSINPKGDKGFTLRFEVNVKDNPTLLALAESGNAEVSVGWSKLRFNKFGCFLGWCKTRVTSADFKIYSNGTVGLPPDPDDGDGDDEPGGGEPDPDYVPPVDDGSGDGGDDSGSSPAPADPAPASFASSMTSMLAASPAYVSLSGDCRDSSGVNQSKTVPLTTGTVIKFTVNIEGQGAGAEGVFIKFQQNKHRPKLTGYTFKANGATRDNKNSEKELYAKKDEYFSLAYNFTEPVRPTSVSLMGDSVSFLKHPLFVNLAGTLLPAAGQQQYLLNEDYKTANFKQMNSLPYTDSLEYRYTAVKYHQNGNIPLQPFIERTSAEKSGSSTSFTIDSSLEQKLRGAELADAAGNLVQDFGALNKASDSSKSYLRNKTVNPFDYEHGGYRAIVDAVRPKYSKTGNGIQPEILTGSTLNNNDSFDFTVQLTEEAVVKTGWDVRKTFLLMNNGMKAYYVSGEGTDKWVFHLSIPGGVNIETPLLKAIALTNDANVINPATGMPKDTNVLQDYAGNLLIQPANYNGIFVDPEDGLESSNVNSKIDWAQLAIDNTKPTVSYRYEPGGATDATYQKNGKMTIDANDATIIVPSLDPVGPGEARPSRGIYRPSNMTGSSSPAVGLVYYWWSQSQADPFESKDSDHFAAVKRYSLTGKQPGEDLYPGEFANMSFSSANNKTNLIVLPTEAFAEENSGLWYLHTWTADMTWDTARELMQYEKKKSFMQDPANQAQYEAWKAEAPGVSEADKIFYADNKVLEKVGKYTLWPMDDFKHDDSNWVHSVGTIKVDNKAPTVTPTGVMGNNTSVVQFPVTITDEHSGVQSSLYQWMKVGSQPQDISWQPVPLTGNSATLTTQNEVVEDGDYVLLIKATDNAGNERIFQSDPITVNSSSLINGSFTTPAAVDSQGRPVFVKSSDVEFKLMGVDNLSPQMFSTVTSSTYSSTVTQDTYLGTMLTMGPSSVYVGYALSGSSLRPAESAFKAFPTYTLTDGGRMYMVPADTTKNGTQYVHIMAKVTENGFEKQYYFSKAYYFDNEPPVVTFSKNNAAYPQASQSVTVTVDEPYSKEGLQKKYQWIVDGQPDPNEATEGWIDLPEDGKAVIDGEKVLQLGEQKNFRLYVWAKDGAGNSELTKTTGVFAISRSEDAVKPPSDVTSDLIYLYGDDEDGYTAIVQLGLAQDSVDKGGYDFSLSPDNGISWMKWRPYTNFVAIKVATNKPSELQVQVKYRTPSGVVGTAKALSAANISKDQPVYALAALSSERPVKSEIGADIDITIPLGFKVTPSAVNPSTPIRTGNKFNVKQNGLYTFDLTDIADASRKATLYAVVKNVDDTKPTGTVEYLTTGKTNGNVTVQLTDLSKPVTITNNEGRSVYKFTQNGSFTFEIKDEAGNTNSVTANVYNIDKEAPQVKVIRSYAYGENNSQTFGTIKDAGGTVRFSSGVTLTVEKADANAKDFTIADGKTSVMLLENGTASFMVSDLFGNTAIVKETVDNIISAPPEAESITYSYVDDAGNPLSDDKVVTINGQKYARGKMKVTLGGRTQAPNMVFAGVAPIVDGSHYSNQISDANGAFTYTRTFSADGNTLVALSDILGNTKKVPVSIKGLDNTPPDIKLSLSSVGIAQNKPDFNFRKDLGGFIVSDNVSAADQIAVSISGLDLSKLGRQKVTYIATDQVGNTAVAYQDVTVVANDGMLIFADDVLISGSSNESALFNHNTLTFQISNYNVMEVGGQNRINEWGTYDLLVQQGLYREGQMKYIATKISYSDLVKSKFKVTLPETGWYTIIVRNQEREREYATFFIGKKE
ncbi:hypothetical protein [Paenibacillus planticolens]|uniref:Uncharacterized protein n=1 Tax=Paenibacillus planticolens TaxID=2654976 RepID=A0ABX1ZM08_9BACL|nr:hypothetical protein [Paenibacillus planticolens]NOU99808.1 hypothetical protein [Paenibacillus planticolens]